MHELLATLADLARLRARDEPIVSLHLDVRWSDEQQRERVRLFVQEGARRSLAHYLPESPGLGGLERTLERVQAYVSGLVQRAHDEDRGGLALFACEALGLWRARLFRRPLPNALRLDAIPHLGALARLADDLDPAVVAVARQDGADVYGVSLGDLAAEASLHGFVPRNEEDEFNPGAARHGRFFERVEKDDRHRLAWVRRNLRASAGEVTRRFEERPGTAVVLVGTPERVAELERELPERVRVAVIARLARPRAWESGAGARRVGVLAGAAEAVACRERERAARRVDAVVGEALRGGQGVLGPADVVDAANQGRIRRLVLEEDFQRPGWRCERCGALGASNGHERCGYCGEPAYLANDLGQELVARTIAEGGDVEVVAHTNKLHSYRGVAAFLRQTGATGLKGAPPPWPTAPGASQG